MKKVEIEKEETRIEEHNSVNFSATSRQEAGVILG